MSIADTGRFWEILVIPVLQILEDSGKYWLYQYCRYCKILENTGYTSIADTGRFWKILVIPILQKLEDSGKYWLYQYCRYWKIRYEVAECTCILFFFVLVKSALGQLDTNHWLIRNNFLCILLQWVDAPDTSCMHTNWFNPVYVPVPSFRSMPTILVILVL